MAGTTSKGIQPWLGVVQRAGRIASICTHDVLGQSPPISRHVVPDRDCGQLAALLADAIAYLRLVETTDRYEMWRAKLKDATVQHADSVQRHLDSTLRLGFDTNDERHLKSLVSENLLYFLCLAGCADPQPLYVRRPKLMSIDHGADGCVIYLGANAEAAFRLWEAKATDDDSVRGGASDAWKQVALNGGEYLARLVQEGPAVPSDAAEVMASCGQMWGDRSPSAGAGAVAIAKSAVAATATAEDFAGHARHLDWADPLSQCRGMVAGVVGVARFASDVKEWLWKGL